MSLIKMYQKEKGMTQVVTFEIKIKFMVPHASNFWKMFDIIMSMKKTHPSLNKNTRRKYH